MKKALVLNSKDNVATAIADIEAGDIIPIERGQETKKVKLKQSIGFGHKFAITTIQKDEPVIKYGEPIGRATRAIGEGDHVHVHNVESMRGK